MDPMEDDSRKKISADEKDKQGLDTEGEESEGAGVVHEENEGSEGVADEDHVKAEEEEDEAAPTYKLKAKRNFFRAATWWTPGYTNPITCVRLFSNGEKLVSGSVDKASRIWDLREDKRRCTNAIFGHTDSLRAVWAHGQRLATAGDDRSVRMLDLSGGNAARFLYRCERHSGRITAMQFDDDLLVTASQDGVVHVFNAADGDYRATISGENFHSAAIWAMRYEGNRLITGSSDKSLMVSNLETNQVTSTLTGHTGVISAVDIQGDIVASGSLDQLVKIWDLRLNLESRCVRTMEYHDNTIAAVSLYDRSVFSGSADETFKCCDLGTGLIVKDVSVDSVVQCLHAADGKLAVGTRRHVVVYDIKYVDLQ